MKKRVTAAAMTMLMVALMLFSSGCYTKADADAVRKSGQKYMAQYMLEKYSERVAKKDLVKSTLGTYSGMFGAELTGNICFELRDGTNVYVDTSSGECYDTRGVECFIDAVEEYIDSIAFCRDYMIFDLSAGTNAGFYFEDETVSVFGKDVTFNEYSTLESLPKGSVAINMEIHWRSEDEQNNYVEENRQFLENIEKIFSGNATDVTSTVYHPDWYLSGECVENVDGKLEVGNTRRMMPVFAANTQVLEINGDGQINYDLRYANFVKAEEGLYFSACEFNSDLLSSSDLVFEKVDYNVTPSDLVCETLLAYGAEVTAAWLESDRIEMKSGVYYIESPLYFASCSSEQAEKMDYPNSSDIFVAIDKKTFRDGILLEEGYGVYSVYRTGRATAAENHFEYYADGDFIFFAKRNDAPFAVLRLSDEIVADEYSDGYSAEDYSSASDFEDNFTNGVSSDDAAAI